MSGPASGRGEDDEATDERAHDVVAALMAEYGSLRAESLAAIEHRMTATNFTFAALAVIVAALVTSDVDRALAGLLLLLAVPQLAKAGLLIWLGEYARSQRAGRHVGLVEARVNELLGTEALTWEGQLVTRNHHLSYPYLAVVGLLLGTGYAAATLGIWMLGAEAADRLPAWVTAAVLVMLGTGLIAWELWFFRYFRRQWVAARTAP